MGCRATGAGACAAYSTYTAGRLHTHDPLSDLYNTDFYFRDCVTHLTGHKPARPACRNHTYGQMLSLSSAKWLQPVRGGDSKGMAEAWSVARGQREHAYLHMWAPKAWPGCPPFARCAVEGCAFSPCCCHTDDLDSILAARCSATGGARPVLEA